MKRDLTNFFFLYVPGSLVLSIFGCVLSMSISKSLNTSPLPDFNFRLAFVSAGRVILILDNLISRKIIGPILIMKLSLVIRYPVLNQTIPANRKTTKKLIRL
jgi:hypothetical protein